MAAVLEIAFDRPVRPRRGMVGYARHAGIRVLRAAGRRPYGQSVQWNIL
jgi:hypothetical protein